MFHLRVCIAACFCAVIVLRSPAFAQISATNSPADKIQYAPSAAPPLRVQNDIVAVQVRTTNDTVGAGEIRYAGLFNIGTPNNLPLLFQFPNDPFSSHVNIRVDGQVYSNDPFRTGALLLTLSSGPTSLNDTTIVCVFTAGPIEVRQRLTPKKFSRTTGAILIEYELVNRDGLNAHQVGVLLELDTFINGNDNAPVLTSFGYSRNEQQFDAPAMPDFFQAFQGNLLRPDTVAQATLVGLSAVRPDRLVIGDWSRLSRVQWDYALPNNTPYVDSAVLLRWNEKNLLPNEVGAVATYYGKGDVTTKAGPLTLHLTALRNLQAFNGQLSPNPFDVNLLVFNNSGGAANAVQATLRLPAGLALVSGEFATKLLAPSSLNASANGTATWKVLAQCPLNDIDLSMTVEVSATPNLANSVTRPLFLPSCSASLPNFAITAQPESATITAGETANFQVRMTALNGFNLSAQLSYFPPTPGITGTFSPATILPNGASSFGVQTNRNLVAGEYRFIILGNSAGLMRSDSVRIVVNAAPPLDTLKPVFANPNPANGATSIPLRPKISVEVYDPAPSSGIDQSSVRMFVNGNLVPHTITSKGAGYVVEYTPTNAFGLNELVTVKVEARDLAPVPNPQSASWSFTAQKDEAPPYLAQQNPAANARDVSLNAAVSMEVWDDLAGVDAASLVLAVDGRVINKPDTVKVAKGYRLQYRPAQPFTDDKRIDVVVRANDLSQPPRPASVFRYFFTTVRDSLPPEALDLFPNENAKNVAPNVEITARLRDDLTGLDSVATQLLFNGALGNLVLKKAGRDYLLRARPATPLRLNDTARVELRFSDLAARSNRDTLRYSFFVEEDKAAPFLTDLNPARNASQAPLQTTLFANVRDEIAGVDSSSINLLVNAQRVQPRLTRAGKEVRVEYGPLTLRDDERVEVEIRAQDLATPPNLMQEQYAFTTVRDLLAPVVLDLQPSPNATNVARDIEIRSRVRDDLAGVDSAAIRLWLNGLAQTPVLRREGKDFVLSFKPQPPFAFNQTITLRLLVADKARVPNVDTTEYSFAVIEDRRAPFVTAHSPARFASNVPPKTAITFDVRDEVAGVDSASLKLRVNGKEVARVLRGNAALYNVSFTPDTALFGASDTVYVAIAASDLSTPPNAMPLDSYHYILNRDRVKPFTAGHKPARNSRDASLDTDIALEILDANPGVDSASIKMFVNGSAVGLRVEPVTNGYRVRHIPSPRLRDNQTLSVKVDARDLAANEMDSDNYTFTTVRDVLAPTARDFSPRAGESNVAPNAMISFVVEDDLTGVDNAALVMRVNGAIVEPSLQPVANGFAVRYDLSRQTLTRDSVHVEIYARDLATQPNDSSLTYDFVTSQDRTPPYLTDFFPRNEETEVPVNTAITFQLRDDILGVDSASVRLFINGENKAVAISGESRVLQVRHQPAMAFALAQRIEVAVEARDRATPPNMMPRRTFHFTTVEPLPDLIVTEFIALGGFQLGKATNVKATLRREGLAVRESFRIEFRADAKVVKDTTIAANTLGATLQVEASAQFDNAGTHVLEVIVDADDRVKEASEANNGKQLVAQLVETLANKLVVRPNPFTPNGDQINDVVEFDFSGLALTNPTLHIFDVNGIAIFLSERASGKRFSWNGRDERGNEVQPGVYLYTLRDSGANVKSGYVVVAR